MGDKRVMKGKLGKVGREEHCEGKVATIPKNKTELLARAKRPEVFLAH